MSSPPTVACNLPRPTYLENILADAPSNLKKHTTRQGAAASAAPMQRSCLETLNPKPIALRQPNTLQAQWQTCMHKQRPLQGNSTPVDSSQCDTELVSLPQKRTRHAAVHASSARLRPLACRGRHRLDPYMTQPTVTCACQTMHAPLPTKDRGQYIGLAQGLFWAAAVTGLDSKASCQGKRDALYKERLNRSGSYGMAVPERCFSCHASVFCRPACTSARSAASSQIPQALHWLALLTPYASKLHISRHLQGTRPEAQHRLNASKPLTLETLSAGGCGRAEVGQHFLNRGGRQQPF